MAEAVIRLTVSKFADNIYRGSRQKANRTKGQRTEGHSDKRPMDKRPIPWI